MWHPTSVGTAGIEHRKCSLGSTCAPARGTFLADQRNVELFGGTGTGKSQLAIAITRALIRNGTQGRFLSVTDLVNRLEIDTRSGKQGRLADYPGHFSEWPLDL